MNEELGLHTLSQPCFSKMRSKHFQEFSIKSRGDDFSRCSECDKLKGIRATFVPGSEEYDRVHRKFQRHLFMQEACRQAYYGSRSLSIYRPSKVLSIIHDKMDHSKTACPAFARKTKSVDGFMKLPVAVTGMFAHGHADEKYAHYSLPVFDSDSNFSVGSIAKLLRDLEEAPVMSSRVLFKGAGSMPLYSALLHGNEVCRASLREPPASQRPAMPLPPVLHIQMDNSWKDNKNRYVFCFWSLLVAKRIVKEVVVSFMMVGHTHDDIDASFGRWSMRLREKDYPTLPLLMQSYMDMEEDAMIPHLVEEVPNFKAFIKPYIAIGAKRLVGHAKGRQFKFFVDDNGWPIMQYKLNCTVKNWLPEAGIKLWKPDADGRPMLPEGQPPAVMPQVMKGEADILRGLDGYIRHWESLLEEDAGAHYRTQVVRCIQYWTRVRNSMMRREYLTESSELKGGFWPQTRQPGDIMTNIMYDGGTREEMDEDEPYIGSMEGRPPPSYNVAVDAQKGFLLFVRPASEAREPVWLGMAEDNPQFDPTREHFREVPVKWYIPCATTGDVEQRYQGWDTHKRFMWKPDPTCTVADYTSTDSILASWKPRSTKKDIQVAPCVQVKFAVDNLRRIAIQESRGM